MLSRWWTSWSQSLLRGLAESCLLRGLAESCLTIWIEDLIIGWWRAIEVALGLQGLATMIVTKFKDGFEKRFVPEMRKHFYKDKFWIFSRLSRLCKCIWHGSISCLCFLLEIWKKSRRRSLYLWMVWDLISMSWLGPDWDGFCCGV